MKTALDTVTRTRIGCKQIVFDALDPRAAPSHKQRHLLCFSLIGTYAFIGPRFSFAMHFPQKGIVL